mmetsp:Transcript_60242/g.193972  ORF Transcript_60242/g.193972 Transcript_60242/m.193972 type:complete len:357 (-) Transcript_60242:756-1826(-)
MPFRPSATQRRAGSCSASSADCAAACWSWNSSTASWKARRTRRTSWPRSSARATSCAARSRSSPRPGGPAASGCSSSVPSRSTATGPRRFSTGNSSARSASRRSRAAPQASVQLPSSAASTASATSRHSRSTASTRPRSLRTLSMARAIRRPRSSSAAAFRWLTRSTSTQTASAVPKSGRTSSGGKAAATLWTSAPWLHLASLSNCTTGPILPAPSCRASATLGSDSMPRAAARLSDAWKCCQASSTLRIRSVPMCKRHWRCSRLARFRTRSEASALMKACTWPFRKTLVWPRAKCPSCSASSPKTLRKSAPHRALSSRAGQPAASSMPYSAQKALYSMRSGRPRRRISSAEMTPP